MCATVVFSRAMSLPQLVALILAITVRDGHGIPIPQPKGFADVVAAEALKHEGEIDVAILAVTMTVVAAHESGFRKSALGDSGKSKGAWQTPTAETPDDAKGQAAVAARWLIKSMLGCPSFPLSLYATGHVCGKVRIAELYWREVRTILAPYAVPSLPHTHTM